MRRIRLIWSIPLMVGLASCGAGSPDANRPPLISTLESMLVAPAGGAGGGNMVTYRVEVEAADPDGDSLSYHYVGEDNAILISPDGAEAEVIISDSRTSARVTVRVEDGFGNLATRDIDLLSDNRSPSITAFEADHYRVRPGESTILRVATTDQDGDSIECASWLGSGAFRGAVNDAYLSSGDVCTTTFTATSNRNGLVTFVVNVTDSRGGRASGELVLRVARDFTLVGALDTSPLKPYALDYTTDGRFFVSDIANHVMEFDASDTMIGAATEMPVVDNGILNIRAMAVDRTRPDEPLYFGSQSGRHQEKVYIFEQNLNSQGDWSLPDTLLPHYLLVRPDGSTLVSNDTGGRVMARHPNGAVETWATGLNHPRQLARDPATGNIYVMDKFNTRVAVFNDDGAFLREWRGVNGDFKDPHGIAVDRRHEIVVVADTNGDRLQVFDLEGNYLLSWSSTAMHVPRYIVIGPNGLYYVASYEDEKVHILDYQ